MALIMMIMPITFSVEFSVIKPIQSIKLLFQHHNWSPVPATVTRVGDASSTMPLCGSQRPQVVYFFNFNGKAYRGDRVYFQDCFPLARSKKIEILQYYQTHKNITVYVNPDNPHEAVITKDPYYNVLANFILYLMIFIAALFFRGLWLILQRPLKKRGYQYTDYLPTKNQDRLNSSGSTSKNVAKTAVFILLIYLAFIPQWVLDPSQGIFYALWAIELSVILYWAWLYFHPKCTIELSQNNIYPNETFMVKIHLSGNYSILESVDVTLSCEEQYYHKCDSVLHRNRSTPLKRHVVWRQDVKQFLAPDIHQSNSFEIIIPKDAATSMRFGHASIKWILKVSSYTKRNVKYNSEFEIVIWPKELHEYES